MSDHDHERLVEAVARAICAAAPEVHMGDASGVVQQRVDRVWREYTSEATAAIAVIRDKLAEPTPEMYAAAYGSKREYEDMLRASPLYERD
jgi:hypothetical protein